MLFFKYFNLNAFIITTALAMRMPGQEKVVVPSDFTKEELLIKTH